MIDIHTHILPGLDDGAADLEQAVAMARVAVADGVTAVVATPHSSAEITRDEVVTQVAALQDALEAAGVPLRVYAGIEVWLSPDVLAQRRTGHAFTIASGSYMLVELPIQMLPQYTDQTIFALQVAGITPVLAHPERYLGLDGNLAPLYRLVERGVLAQLSAGSLLGAFGPRAKALAEAMLAQGLAHVIASDAHSAQERAPKLSGAVARATEIVGKERATAMVSAAPESILAGLPVELPELISATSKRRWLPWRR